VHGEQLMKTITKTVNTKRALAVAVRAARAAGALMRRELHSVKRRNLATQHDIKLELDVICQKLIERSLRSEFPHVAVLGEEGMSGDQMGPTRWVVDPIDGTVNFTYTIPHASVSIALQEKRGGGVGASYPDGYLTTVGVVYDPFCDELWTAIRGQPARLHGAVIRASNRRRLAEAIISIGFARSPQSLATTVPCFLKLLPRVRKVRLMGSAALALTYVATGRFDAYIERGISLWDIAAGGLIVECAGGRFRRKPIQGAHAYSMIASNGRLDRQLPAVL
jgi:myo-inositol-1(or 4)-monophosphatase